MGVYQKTVVVDGITPVAAYSALRENAGEGSFLLESVVPGERWGRYSILGYRPRRHVSVWGKEDSDPFAELGKAMAPGATGDPDVASRFCRALVGVVNYDAVHYATKVDPWPDGSEREPVARLVGDATVVVFDNLTHTATIAASELADIERAEHDLCHLGAFCPMAMPDPQPNLEHVDVDTSDEEYGRNVERIREYIRAGDAFQVVLARTFSVPTNGADPFDVYRALCVLSPAPYMYLIEFPARPGAPPVAIAGASPETLVRVEGRRITLRPIAGTRRRGHTPDEDEALAAEMLADPKERAEHVMLIDLARNDVGRVARSGSVHLPQQMVVERYSHVMHIVSEVTGELGEAMGPWDVVRASFPAGTLSGAPKVRAMQIIRELERRPRGAYGGAIGYVTQSTDLDFAIAIRTVVTKNGRFEVTAGAGIVADSVPRLECKETRNKARAALASIHAAHRQRAR